jgi:antitoxin ParD1/3/4
MSNVTSINLGDHFVGFVSGLTESGRYKNTSEAVRAGLRLLEEQEKLAALNSALAEGEVSGESTRDFDEIVNEAINEVALDDP